MPEMEREDGRGVLEISKGRGPFYNSYWNTLNALAVRCHRSFSSWACWCSMNKCSILHLLNFFTKRELNISIMLYPVLFAIRHSILPHPSPHVFAKSELSKTERFQKSDSDPISLWRSVLQAHCKIHTHAHTYSTGRWAPSVTQGNSLHFINFCTFFRCEGKPPTHTHTHTHTRGRTQPSFSISCSIFLKLFLCIP